MNKQERIRHFSIVASLPCMVTGSSPVVLHHPHSGSMRERGVHKAMSAKVSDFLVIPITDALHKELHQGIEAWEAKYGTQAEMVDRLCQMLGKDLWALAREKPERKYKKPSKICPRRD